MKLSRVNLLKTLSILGNAVGNKVMQIADFVKISYSAETRRLQMSTTDYNAFLTVDHGEVDFGDDSFDLLIEYKKFANIVRCSTTDDVELVDKGDYVQVKTNGTYKFQKWEDVSDFPSADFSCEKVTEFESTDLASAWSKAVIAVSKDIGKLSFQGVNYDGSFAATDNRRLSVVRMSDQSLDPVLLPPTMGSIISQCSGKVDVGVSDNGKALVIVSQENSMLASVRILDATFPDYRKFLATADGGTDVLVSLPELVGACERMEAFTDNTNRTFDMEIHGGESSSIHMQVNNKGAALETMDVKLQGDEAGEGVVSKHTYMLDHFMAALNVVDSGQVVSFTVKENGMMWIKESTYLHLLQPIAG